MNTKLKTRVLMMPDYRKDNPYQSLLSKSLELEGVDVVFPAGYRRVFPLWRAVRLNRPIDVLHLHWCEPFAKGRNWFERAFYWIKLLTDLCLVRFSGVRVVWTLHNVLPHECSHPKMETFFRSRLLRLVSQVIVHGEQSRKDAMAMLHCPSEKMNVAPHGNYRDVYPKATTEMRDRARAGIPDDQRVFLFFGYMRKYKGIERLLRVWTALSPTNASLWLAGPCFDETYEASLRSEASKIKNVRIDCGFIADQDVTKMISGADFVVLPFEKVQTSGSTILALSFGKPVIAPRIGEIPETLGEASDLIFEPGSDCALSEAIQKGLRADIDDLAKKSISACNRLDWAVAGKITAKVYRTIRAPYVRESVSTRASCNGA